MRRLLTIIYKCLTILLILLILGSAGGYLYLRRSLPQLEGLARAPGLHAPIEIVRDVDSIPHIYAQTGRDALFGLGYVHAQDRLWQLEFSRHISQGRLSELFGPPTVDVDRFLRTVGIMRAATSSWQALSAEEKAPVEAYIAGINAFLATHQGSRLPLEFTVFGVTPQPWSGPEVLAWLKMLAFNLSNTYARTLLRNDLIHAVGVERMRQLLPAYPQDGLSTLRSWTAAGSAHDLLTMDDAVRAWLGAGGSGRTAIGSNAWVIDGMKSSSGMPILANDPHLGTGTPAPWYLAHLSAANGDLDVIGATIPALPGVVIGRNRSIAWGITNFNPAVQDLFRERLDSTRHMAEFKGQWEPLQVITETIKIAGQPDQALEVRLSRHGPLIADALMASESMLPPEQRRTTALEPMALGWTGLDPADRTITTFLNINRAASWADFTHALEPYVAPPLNFLYADTAGNIGYYAPGRVPIRAHGQAALPVEGWSGAAEWVGWVPFAALPHAFNPPEHILVNANNRPVSAEYPFYLGQDWVAPYRAQRISDLAHAKERLSADDVAAMQADTLSLYAREILPPLIALLPRDDPETRQAIDLLMAWDGTMSGESAAAAILESWLPRLSHAISDDELGPQLSGHQDVHGFLMQVLKEPNSPWCDVTQTAAIETCAEIARQTLRETLADLKARQGSQMQRWRWDAIHQAVFPYAPFDGIGPLRAIFRPSIPNGGDEHTIDLGQFDFNQPFEQTVAPTYRQVIDLSDLDAGRFILAPGQSGHPLSEHYKDYLEDWQAVRYRPMRMRRSTVDQAQVATLRLEP